VKGWQEMARFLGFNVLFGRKRSKEKPVEIEFGPPRGKVFGRG